MEGSNRYRKLIRTALPSALVIGVVAVAGCGGGGGSSSNEAKAPTPAGGTSSSSGGGVVSAEGTLGLVGPAGRVTAKKQSFEDQQARISPKANRRPGAGKKGGVGAGDSCNNRDITPSDSNIGDLNDAILCLVNGERADNGLPALTHVSQLDQSSSGMCQRMVSEHFFSHETPDGKTVVDRVEPTGYIPKSGDWVVGENLAWGSGALSTPQAIVNGWMNSPGHRANILAPDYKDIGMAACMGSPSPDHQGGTVYVNNFGAKSGADVNATLPSEGGSSGSGSGAGDDTSTVAGTKATTASKKAKSKKKHKRKKKRRKRH
jgi:uncharacterized protein YkwD